MNILIKDVDKNNWIECINLTTNGDNSHTIYEEYLASNVFSLAQANIEEGWEPKAIYHDNILVGFVMYGYLYKEDFYEICRIMIDHKFQNKGYGKVSLHIVIRKMIEQYNLQKIYIRFDPENIKAQKIYERFGFKDTKRIIDNEKVYSLDIKNYKNI